MKTKILSVTCAVLSVIVFTLSFWIFEQSKGAYMGMIGEFYASIGLAIGSVLAVGGIVSGVICKRRKKSANETSHFSLDMKVLTLMTLEAGTTTALDDCPPISLGQIARVAITVECLHTQKAQKPIRLHVRSSYDGLNYDNEDLNSFDNELRPGEITKKTFELDTKARFIKVLAENLDKSQQISDIKITASLNS